MNAPLFILQISDCHFLQESGETLSGIDTEQSLKRVLKYANEKQGKADLILVSGDLAEEPSPSTYQRIVSTLLAHQTRSICLPGNHDDLALMQQFINTKTINCDKHIAFKHWQIISLNSKKTGSQGGYLEQKELLYLTKTLRQYPKINTLVAIHHHLLPTNSPWMDKMIIENNEELLNLLKKYPQVKLVTCGHIHQRLHIQSDNLLVLGSPSTCFQFKPLCTEYTLDNKPPGYRTLYLYPNGRIKTNIHYLPS
ncbi:MAG: 3',5'-cyclic-AMP phosphodiesterase [Methylococcales symbiont of Hymedesmia sp. n. MRB-2018]|nr:MAG: 3',5'-cyclic-AMP phosphodiesterase [Methylococcales symbiont of Hymedesmia sp. n. MRB-2018]KAF3983462.1 MAG: 3',5'-cyclic-AMP phosphodiesterase [Methylococcales symbiont of Hymedesmia sp. n. MRB-2018]